MDTSNDPIRRAWTIRPGDARAQAGETLTIISLMPQRTRRTKRVPRTNEQRRSPTETPRNYYIQAKPTLRCPNRFPDCPFHSLKSVEKRHAWSKKRATCWLRRLVQFKQCGTCPKRGHLVTWEYAYWRSRYVCYSADATIILCVDKSTTLKCTKLHLNKSTTLESANPH